MTIPVKKGIYFVVLAVCLSSCFGGTKTMYKTKDKFDIKIMGFNRVDKQTILPKIYPQTDSVFTATVFEMLAQYGIDSSQDFKTDMIFDNPDRTTITQFCEEHKLDGFLLTKIKFIYARHSVENVHLTTQYDTEVEMKLFDKNGELLFRTWHSTIEGNTYPLPPKAHVVVRDGTRGALKRILKLMGQKKVKS